MDLVVPGKHLTELEHPVAASKVSDESAGFPDQQYACRRIPGLEVFLPEPIEPASRDPCEIERGRSEATDSGDFGRHCVEDLGEPRQIAVRLERDAGRNKRIGKVAA